MTEDEIKQRIEKIKKERKIRYRKLFELRTNYESTIEDREKVDAVFNEIQELDNEQKKLEDDLLFLKPLVMSDGEIDLREFNDSSQTFLIYLNNSRTCVGDITYRSYHCSPYFGDVGYNVYPEFQGNNYAYKALVLLSRKLNEKGIKDFWISTFSDNVASVKTIEKYGGNLISSDSSPQVLLFECDTEKYLIKEEDNKKASLK